MRLNQKIVANWIKRSDRLSQPYNEPAFILCLFSAGFCFLPPCTVPWTVAFLLPAALIFPALVWVRRPTLPVAQQWLLQAGLCSTYATLLCLLAGAKLLTHIVPSADKRLLLPICGGGLLAAALLWLTRLWMLSIENEAREEHLSRLCRYFGLAAAVMALAAFRFLGSWYEKRHPSADRDLIFFCGCLLLLALLSIGGTLTFLKAALLDRHPDRDELLEHLAQNNTDKAQQRYAAYKAKQKNKQLKKRLYWLFALVLFMGAFLLVHGADGLRRELFCHDEREHIARIEIVFAENVAPDDTVEYTVTQTVDNETGCIRRLRLLPQDKNMLTPKAVRRVREQAYMFKITYNDGCWELVDAAGRFVVPSPDCGPINGQSYWHDGGPVVFQQAAFDALVQTFLEEPVSP